MGRVGEKPPGLTSWVGDVTREETRIDRTRFRRGLDRLSLVCRGVGTRRSVGGRD